MEEEDLTKGMMNAYWIQAFPALVCTKRHLALSWMTTDSVACKAATKLMAKQGVHGRIVFVGSTLGYMSFLGYSNYSPGKHALVGKSFYLCCAIGSILPFASHLLYPICKHDSILIVPCLNRAGGNTPLRTGALSY